MVEAIAKLKCNAAPGQEGDSAWLLKGCTRAIAISLELIWNRSHEEGILLLYYKLSIVTALHKKEDRVLPGDCRPMS